MVDKNARSGESRKSNYFFTFFSRTIKSQCKEEYTNANGYKRMFIYIESGSGDDEEEEEYSTASKSGI